MKLKNINIIIYFNYYIFILLYEIINFNLKLISSSVNGYKMINYVKKRFLLIDKIVFNLFNYK